MFSQWIVIPHGVKYFNWPGTFFLIARKSQHHKHKHFGAIKKDIFWSSFNKEPRVTYDVTKKYRVSIFVKPGIRIVKLKLFGLISQIITMFLGFILSKMIFSCHLQKDFPLNWYFSTQDFKKTFTYLYTNIPRIF